MPHRNRVAPTGEIVAMPLRGLFTGNRGCLHEGEQVVRPWRGKLWITCLLDFRGRRLPLWRPGRWTPLFFYDEAVALAAGHRPCAFCRRGDYNAYRDAWTVATGEDQASAVEMNDQLHADRLDGRHQRRHRAAWSALPDFVFVDAGGGPALVLGDRLLPWSAAGYGVPMSRPGAGVVDVLTPRANVEVLRAGYSPLLHPTVRME